MPFGFYGAKKGTARRYPPPGFDTIIEPFAGSAGYALAWATPRTRVILVEKNPVIAETWRRLKCTTREEILAIECPPLGEPSGDPLIAMSAGAYAPDTKRGPGGRLVSERIRAGWPTSRRRIALALPRIRDWQLIEGDYTEAPDVRATWFIDAPYATRDDHHPGTEYHSSSETIDYAALGAWCQARRGQVIVCEQEGADWLPFRPLYAQTSQGKVENGVKVGGARRVEVVWSRTPGNLEPGTRRFDEAHEQRKQRRRRRPARS